MSIIVDAKLSYATCVSDLQFSQLTLGQLLELQSRKTPKKIAIISVHEKLEKTFLEFNCDVTQLANALRTKSGLQFGDRISIWSANCYNYLVIQYAAARAGLFIWQHNPNYKSAELQKELDLAEPDLIFLPAIGSPQQQLINDFVTVLNQVQTNSKLIFLDNQNSERSQSLENYSNRSTNYKSSGTSFEDFIANCDREVLDFDGVPSPRDPFTAFFTSGSTGAPKAVVLSHFAIINSHLAQVRRMDFTVLSNYCLATPLFHAFGSLIIVPIMLTQGATMLLPSYKYSTRTLATVMDKFKCSHLGAVPTMLMDLIDYGKEQNLQFPNWKGLVCGAAAMPVESSRKLAALVPSLTCMQFYYGASEVMAISYPLVTDNQEQNFANVGVPIDFVEIKVVDAERRLVAIGELGVIMVRTPFVMSGYHKNEEKTREALDGDGWYDTGDIGSMDCKGYVSLNCRVNDVINRGGVKIHPKDIEEVLYANDDVQFAAVFGVPDARLGQELCAWIKLKSGKYWKEDGVRQFLKAKLAYFKVPKYILFGDDPPMTGSGKVLKGKLRQQVASQLRLPCIG